ncbi:tripartite tricarboxylate transporter substrate binding protein, partial [Corallococcus coralloides]|nr:tripartite tricarboxylate transporter substrate binding protein [Corallococcus coralloides]
VQELIAYAKANPGKINFGSSGSGSSIHLSGELFKSMAKVDMQHVPYKGSAPAVTDLLGGQVQSMFDNTPSALPHVQGGRLRAIAITSAQRSPLLPDVPTVAEQGYPGYDVSVFFGVVAPAGTPADRIALLNKAFTEALSTAKVKTLFASQGLEAATDTRPQALGRFIADETAKWGQVVKQSGVSLD